MKSGVFVNIIAIVVAVVMIFYFFVMLTWKHLFIVIALAVIGTATAIKTKDAASIILNIIAWLFVFICYMLIIFALGFSPLGD